MPSRIEIEGNWFRAGTSAAVPARFRLNRSDAAYSEILLPSGDVLDVEIISVSDRVGSIDRRLEMRGGHVFITKDNDAVDQLAAAKRGIFSSVFSLERFHPRLFAFLAIAVGLVVAFFVYGLPITAKVAAWATPPQVVQWMDQSTLATLDRIVMEESTLEEGKREEINSDFAKLVTASRYDGRLTLLFRNGGPMGPNALALPGGTVILTDQLVALGSSEEITAVLAHEIAHVQEEHSLQQLYRALGFAGMIALFAGDVGVVAEEVLAGGGVLVAMAASREMELDADEKAVGLLRKVDIDPINLSTMLDKLYQAVCKGNLEECEESGWLSSHPGGKERRDALKGHIHTQ